MKIATKYNFKNNELKNKVILVTGANRGLGRAVSIDLARAGAEVILLGRDLAGIEEVYDEITTLKLKEPILYPLDLEGATPENYQQMTKDIDKHFKKLDGIIHNAGILGALMPIELHDIKLWYQTMQINVNAPFMLTQALIPLLKKSADARVLFLSSTVGRKGRAYWGAYGISKFAIEGFMQTLADELEKTNIKVNSINPGAMRTKMRRIAYPAEDVTKLPTPEDISPAFVYLMSKKAKGIHANRLFLQD